MKEMVGGCCVCSDERGWDENPLVYCDGNGCTVAVHQACYGIVTVPKGPWFCRKCESQERAARVRCELCPQKEGALKRTDTGGWCHVVCALFIPEAWFGNVQTMEPIILKGVPQERYNKSCYICELQDREGKANTGGCMQCNKSGCRYHFHVTCAQAQGLLCEEAGNLSSGSVKYCGYCTYHYKKVKRDGTVKVIPPFRSVATEGDSQEKDKNQIARGTKPKLRLAASQANSNQPAGSSPALTTSKAESKERALSKSSLNSCSDSSTAETSSLAFRNTPTTTSCDSGVKNILGRFTTANFVETTISSSPANFDNVDEKEKKEKALTTTSLATLHENPGSSVFCSNSETQESKGSRSNFAMSSKPTERNIGISADSKLLANFKMLEGTGKFSDLGDKDGKIAELRNGRSSPDMAEKSAMTSSQLTSLFATAAPKSTFSHSFANFLTEKAKSSQHPVGPASTETYDSELSDTPMNNKRTNEQEPKDKRRSKKQKTERNVAKSKTVKDLLTPQATVLSVSSVTLQKTFSPSLSVSSGILTSGTAAKKPAEATFQKFYASGLVDRSSEYVNSLSSSSAHTLEAAASGIVSVNNGVLVSSSQRICPPPFATTLCSSSNHASSNSEALDPSHFPTSVEDLLHRQWVQGSQFLMEQGQMLDISSLLNCLHDLRQENQRLEERIGILTARRDNLLAVNARLSVPFSPPNNTHRSTATPHSIDGTSPEHHVVNRHASKSPRANNCLPGDKSLRDPETVFGVQGPASRVGSISAVSGLMNRSPLRSSSGSQRLNTNQMRFSHSGGSQSAVGVMPPGSGLRQQSPPRPSGVTGSLPVPPNLLGFPSSLSSGTAPRVDLALFAEQLQRQQFLQQNPSLEQNRQLLYQLQQVQLLTPSSISITAPGSTSLSHHRPFPIAHSLAGDLLPSSAQQQPPLPTAGRASEAKNHQNKADGKS